MSRSRIGTLASALAGVMLAVPTPTALAQVVPNPASLHAVARTGGKTCMIEHEHYGEGSLPSRHGAEAAARRAWESFTAWEYGTAWGSYAAAAGAKMSCEQASGRWTCKTTARPCRR
jgi:hypothetical protein